MYITVGKLQIQIIIGIFWLESRPHPKVWPVFPFIKRPLNLAVHQTMAIYVFSLVELLSRVRLFATLWITAHQASLSITNSQRSLRLSPLSPWCHPAISSSVVPFSSCPQSLPASESFPMSLLFAWGGQSTRVSALASFLPKKSQGWSP